MNKIIYSVALFILGTANLFGAKAKVKINIENSTKQLVTVYVGIVEGVDALPKTYRPVFQLTATGTEMRKVYENATIEKGSTVFIYAVLEKGGKTKPQEYVINKKTFEDNLMLLITKDDINSQQSIEDIQASFSNFSNNGLYHEVVNTGKTEAFKSIFGSFIIIDKDSNVTRIPATALKSNRDNYTLTGNNFSLKREFKKDAVVNMNGSIPLTADMSFMFGNSEFASFEWTITNAGLLQWSLPSGETPVTVFYKNLDSVTKDYFAHLYLKDSSLRMYFIDKAYVIEGYNLKSYAFQKLTTDAEINVSIYGSATANYIKSDETTITVSKVNIVSDVWGSNFTDILRQNAQSRLRSMQQQVVATNDTSVINDIYQTLLDYGQDLPDATSLTTKNLKKELLKGIKAKEEEFVLPAE